MGVVFNDDPWYFFKRQAWCLVPWKARCGRGFATKEIIMETEEKVEETCVHCQNLEDAVALAIAKRDLAKSRKDSLNKLYIGITILVCGVIAAYMNRGGGE